ncbi:hypothetical protein B0H12DRAFT_1234611 [Mycena haematopus]|nr:hypothetical protein B0H12DRAFT_1234611 [Mycena haematopus]
MIFRWQVYRVNPDFRVRNSVTRKSLGQMREENPLGETLSQRRTCWCSAAKGQELCTAYAITALIALRTPVPNLRHAYYAPPHTIESFPPIAELIGQNSDEPISPNEPQLSAALADAPAFVEAWAKETQTLLVSLLPGTEANKADFLDRATSVFRVRITNEGYEKTVIGWEEARAHLHWFQGRPEPHSVDDHLVKFNARGSAAAAELAVLLGMDPATATATGILHVGTNVPASHDVPSWHRLSPLAVADVRRREEPDDYAPVRAWSCTLCNDFAPLFETQKNIEHHIRIKHGIDEPVEGEHLILFKGSESPRRKRVKIFIAGAHPARYRCNRCAQDHPDLVKLFSGRAIRLHVQDKHLVELSDDPADDRSEVQLLVTPGDLE